MAQEVKVTTQVKKTKEEIVRLQTDAAIPANAEEQMYPYGGSAGTASFEVKTGEAAELIAAGVAPPAANLEYSRFTDREGKEWNKFLTQIALGFNELPMNNLTHFEKQLMSWGYTSYLNEKAKEGGALIAPTWKLSEGDQFRLYAGAGAAPIAAVHYATLIIRRYKEQASAFYTNFDKEIGGFRSNRWYYNNYQKLATTVVGQYTTAWNLDLMKQEAYKIFTGGVTDVTNLVEAKIMIDDPETEVNRYFVMPTGNQLPYVDTYAVDPGAATTQYISKMHRFIPTIDVLKDHNKSLSVLVKDNGGAATNLYARMVGVRYIL